jgi:2-phospho-L-lactate/phosphoenolpyruvate guanylyltransferase
VQTQQQPWVVVPVKSFTSAKQRLAEVLDPMARQHLAAQLAAGVIRAAAPWPVIVVSGDAEVAAFAQSLQAQSIDDPKQGLNAAVRAGVDAAASQGATRVVIVHADLPLAFGLPERLSLHGLALDEVLIVPDRHLSGTNVLVLPTPFKFVFHYGPGSFQLHCQEAALNNLHIVERRDQQLALDIDTPFDLLQWQQMPGTSAPGLPAN